MGLPAGSVGELAQLPTDRRKRGLGRRSSTFWPPFSMMRFQRFTPFSQSRTYAVRMISFIALRIEIVSAFAPPLPSGTSSV